MVKVKMLVAICETDAGKLACIEIQKMVVQALL